MKFYMKNIFMTAAIAVAFLAVSCSDWNTTESLDLRPPTPQEKDPAAYQSYMEALRKYKKSDHKMVMVTVKGSSKAPNLQSQHITSLPDSVDYICMSDVVDLHPTLVSEMTQVRNKGTQVLCVVDYMSIDAAWKLIHTDENGIVSEDASDADAFGAYCKEQTELQLSRCDKYGFDGIQVSYLGNTASPASKRGQEVFMECIETWRQTHYKLFIFRGYIRNVLNKSVFEYYDYIVIPAGSSSTSGQLTLAVPLLEGVPTDRYVIEVAIPPLAEPTQVGATAQVAAAWVNEPYDKYTKSGLSVHNAQDDYYNIDMIYKNIRQATAIMNSTSNNDDDEI